MKREYVKMQNYLQKQRDEYAMGSADRKASKMTFWIPRPGWKRWNLTSTNWETTVRNERIENQIKNNKYGSHIIIVLIVIGLLLLMAEVFLIPGTSIASLPQHFGMSHHANFYAFQHVGFLKAD